MNGADLTGASGLFSEPGTPPSRVGRSRRIGVEYAGAWARKPWRLFVAGNRFVSKG
ncbi:MAG: hypothetical protein AABZ30_02100 [Myxococcota bacterium]